MNKNLLVVIMIFLVTLGTVVVLRAVKNEQVVQLQPVRQQPTQKTFSTQTDSQGEVSVGVTPKILGGGREASFQVTLETHSVELDQDLVKVSKLTDDKGNEYALVSWSGETGGHHLSGDLTFPKISDQTKSVELLISGVGGVERTFKWEL